MSNLLVCPDFSQNLIEDSDCKGLSLVARSMSKSRLDERADACGGFPLSLVAFTALGQLDTVLATKAASPDGPCRATDESDRAPPIPFSLR